MRWSHLERAARRQVLPCFGRLERAMASDPMSPPKTATLVQLLPWVSMEICQLVGGPDAWAGHSSRCNGPGLLSCLWALVAAGTGRRADMGSAARGRQVCWGRAGAFPPLWENHLCGSSQPSAASLPALGGKGQREQAKLLLPAPAVSHLAAPVKPVIQPGLDPAACRLPCVPNSLSCWLVIRERLTCPRNRRAPASLRDGPKANIPEGWDKAVGTQYLGDCLGSSGE